MTGTDRVDQPTPAEPSITIETRLDGDTTEMFRQVYRAGFDPLAPMAAGRQALTDEEFRAEMVNPAVLKFLGRDADSRAVALLTVSTDLHQMAWLSPAFYEQRFPDHAARQAIFYVGSLVVHPEASGGSWMRKLTAAMSRYANERSGIVAFDCCQHNIDSGFPRHLEWIAQRVGSAELQVVDTQQYYAYIFPGPEPTSPEPTALDLNQSGPPSLDPP